jgi:hypothetical protein
MGIALQATYLVCQRNLDDDLCAVEKCINAIIQMPTTKDQKTVPVKKWH